ncbi:MAG: DNA repair protein RecN [gamma proteobacterium symbiont of Bathyaustriella thionipta]|nr:DNA repair protein RecN [gamma proteobacterium symbiont of Bathyaustriella thionipta]MCU7948969.1 DNA repair protein RecN [gamma proteobacterium symbiont of Bathyaustriella thionipta]MCU7953971.1 DNA repair protein RecN [gamma proteobacterium symbiont of Bathyaustriella thionipta]MCU7955514.1 DNA repair protein RecN [gamma proteobacterium symbiont of Bathyaustriella thionipta]MCU7965695.1 DNA repair protein RecN [gamma proteobacterium symbiont of Bathyaustriella thionipta]
MLNHITIKNLAVVDSLDLELRTGLSVLTGETGAGKSILIDALGLVLGDRAEASAIRHGAERADISAEFALQDANIEQWLQDNELDSDGECLIRRTISAKGRSRGFINGQPIPLQLLRELGEKLVNIHGQNTHQALLKSDEQRLLLDNFAGISQLRKELNQYYQQWKKKSSDYQILKQDTAERDARLDLLRFQVQELSDFELQENELPELEDEHRKLSNANRLIETSQSIHFQLAQDEQHGINHLLSRCLSELQCLSDLDNSLNPISEMLNNALIQVDEASSELRHYLDSLELNPEQLQWLDNRISSIYDLARKHRVETHELFAHTENLKKELAQLENADVHLETLLAEVEAARADYFKLAKKLSSKRNKASGLLAEQVIMHIHELGMERCQFEIRLLACKSEQPQLHGMEIIEFYVTTNPGQPLRPLSKVVSGGELSRISLAIQVVTAQFSDIPTLIFDEVDVGIGGGIAEMVGSKLRLLGTNSQILCVTHQAQVATQAHQHLNVYKQSNETKTTTSISLLDEEQRIEELSRMMGGIKITEQTRSHAREMRKQVTG